MFFLPLCKYFFFYGIKPIRRISRQSRENAFQFKLLFFSFYIFDRKERLDSGQKYLFAPLKNKTTTKNRLQLGLLGFFCLSAQQEDTAAFCFWVSIAPPFFSPYTYHPVFFFCLLFFPLIFFQLWAAPASMCVVRTSHVESFPSLLCILFFNFGSSVFMQPSCVCFECLLLLFYHF